MECNKEEAIRAREIAERKMQSGDFLGAKRFANKSKQLDPDVQNISQLLMVCEVHISAQNKLNRSEMDWYGILQVERFCDESIIKKQYKKLALTLHPDKNKFPGAEAAFKLIGEANRVLTDPAKRSLYDMKFRGLSKPCVPKPAPQQSNRNFHTKRHHGVTNRSSGGHHSHSASSNPHQQSQRPTFWTCCPFCSMRYQYYRDYLNKMLRCQGCQRSFTAHDVGIHGVPSANPRTQIYSEKAPSQGPSKADLQGTGAKPSPDTKQTADVGFNAEKLKVEIASDLQGTGAKPSPDTKQTADVGFNPEKLKVEIAVETGAGILQEENANGHMDVGAGAGKGDGMIPDATNCAKSKTSGSENRKRCWKPVEESDKRFDTSGQNNEQDAAHPGVFSPIVEPRRSSRKKQHVSYNENLNDDNLSSPPKRSNGEKSHTVEEVKKETNIPTENRAAGFVAVETAVVDLKKSEIKPRGNFDSKESLFSKRTKTEDCNTKGEEVSMVEKSDAKSEHNVGKPKVEDKPTSSSDEALQTENLHCPDADFNNFDNCRAISCLAVDQVWAIYDPADSMPRYYAWVRKVSSSGFKIKITWLEAFSDDKDEQNWCDAGLPVSCGKFKNGKSQMTNLETFSHQMDIMGAQGKGSYLIYPKKGETWALFKDWNKNWSSESEEHGPPYQFEFVEILSDFNKDYGIGVTYLCKVKGFVSIFKKAAFNRVIACFIKPSDLYRFSHRIPSVKMTGKEGEGVPAGSFEFDPASFPANLDDLCDLIDVDVEKENLNAGAADLSKFGPNSSEKICIPKKHENGPKKGGEVQTSSAKVDLPSLPSKLYNHDAENEDGNGASGSCSMSLKDKPESTRGPEPEKICRPKKQGSIPERGTSKLGKSERRSNGIFKSDNLVDECQFARKSKRSNGIFKGGNVVDDCIQVDERIKTPKTQTREFSADAFKRRRSPRDLRKRNSQASASQFVIPEDTRQHTKAGSDVDCGESRATSNIFHDKAHSSVKDGGLTGLERKASGFRVVEVDPYDFKKEKSEDKFKVSQIWALYGNEDGLPKKYCEVRKIERGPNFKLHVSILESCLPQKKSEESVSCGKYKAKSGTMVLSPCKFSHLLNAKWTGTAFEIRPGKGEVWAVYKNWNSESTCSDQGTVEYEFVEVLEDDGQIVKVVVLMSVNGCESFYWAPRIQRSKAGVKEIADDELGRFSHRCSAYRHVGNEDTCLKDYWELDSSSIPRAVIMLD